MRCECGFSTLEEVRERGRERKVDSRGELCKASRKTNENSEVNKKLYDYDVKNDFKGMARNALP